MERSAAPGATWTRTAISTCVRHVPAALPGRGRPSRRAFGTFRLRYLDEGGHLDVRSARSGCAP